MTERQAHLLAYIRSRLSGSGIAPSYDEMAAALGIKSRSGVKGAVDRLVDQGLLIRLARRPRGLALPDVPTVVLRWPPNGGAPELYVFGNGPVRLLCIDEGAPGDRIFEVLTRFPFEQLAKLVPEGSAIGSSLDPHHRALAARIEAASEGRPHLKAVEGAE